MASRSSYRPDYGRDYGENRDAGYADERARESGEYRQREGNLNDDRRYNNRYHDGRQHSNYYYSRSDHDSNYERGRPASRGRNDNYRASSPNRRSSLDYDGNRGHYEHASNARREPEYDERPTYRGREDEWRRRRSRSRSPRGRSRSPPSRSPRKHEIPKQNPPSREVKLSGLPKEMDNNSLRSELAQRYEVKNITDARVIRYKETNDSRGFGFVTFADLESSQEFMQQHRFSLKLGESCARGDRRIELMFVEERGPRANPSVPAKVEHGATRIINGDEQWYCAYSFNWNPATASNCVRCAVIRPKEGAVPMAQSIFNPTASTEQANTDAKNQNAVSETASPALDDGDARLPKPKLKKQKLATTATPQTAEAANHAKWQKIHDDMRAEEENGDAAAGDQNADAEYVEVMSYADPHPDHLICLLCCAQFPDIEALRRHELISKLHAYNAESRVFVAFATKCLNNIGKQPKMIKIRANAGRDRARERRMEEQAERKKLRLELGKDQEQEEQAPVPAPMAKGAALLAKAGGSLGWTAGQGLGARGEGITAPIEATGHSGGAGLGAAGSTKNTEGLSQKEVGLQKATERYNKIV